MNEPKTVFKLISKLWKEFEDKPAVPRRVLHERILETMPEAETEVEGFLTNGGIDIALDAYAKSGAHFKNFIEVLNENESAGDWFRYQVIRDSDVVYVPYENLTVTEFKAIIAQQTRQLAVYKENLAVVLEGMAWRKKFNAIQ